MKVYIAGKITGDKAYKAKFARAEQIQKERGNIVLNPAVLPEGMAPGDYMRICMAMMECADMVVFLPDWNESQGARLEMRWCQYTGKPVCEIENMGVEM